MQSNKNIEYLQNKYLQEPLKYEDKVSENDEKQKIYLDKCALIIQRNYRRYQSQKQIQRLDTQNEEDEQQLERMSQQNNVTASKLQEDIKTLKMELFKSLNQLKGFQSTDKQQMQQLWQYQTKHVKKAKIIQQFWRKSKEYQQNKQAFKDIQFKKIEELKMKYNQILEENLLQQKLQFKQVLNSYLGFIEKLMQDKKEISEQCKKYHELHQKGIKDNQRQYKMKLKIQLEKIKEELNKKISDLYVEQAKIEKENVLLKQKLEENDSQQKQNIQQNLLVIQKQEQNLKELLNVKKQIEDEKNNLFKEKDQIMKEQAQLQKIIQAYQTVRRRDKSRDNSTERSNQDTVENQIQQLKTKLKTIEQEKDQIENKLQQILQQNERFVEEKQILLQEQQNFLSKEHKILEVIKINKDIRNRYKQIKEENELLQKQLDTYRSSNQQSSQFNSQYKPQRYNYQQENDENSVCISDNDLIEKYSRYSRNSSPSLYTQNNSIVLSDAKTNLASMIKEERLKTLEAMKMLQNNISAQASRENSRSHRK